ncbi:MAG: hypothetical protein ACI83O_000671 [Patescibacteria group bacterium]|jgi:glutamate synthase domain-containing protein 3
MGKVTLEIDEDTYEKMQDISDETWKALLSQYIEDHINKTTKDDADWEYDI